MNSRLEVTEPDQFIHAILACPNHGLNIGDKLQIGDSMFRVLEVADTMTITMRSARWYNYVLHYLREWWSGVDYINPRLLDHCRAV